MGTMRCMYGHNEMYTWAQRGVCMGTERCVYGHREVYACAHSGACVWAQRGVCMGTKGIFVVVSLWNYITVLPKTQSLLWLNVKHVQR